MWKLITVAAGTGRVVSVLWVEVSCGEGEYCWLLCYQIMPNRLCHRARRELVYVCAVAMPNCSADNGLKAISIRGVSETHQAEAA